MESEDVLFEKKEHHAVITFNRPKKYNSVLASVSLIHYKYITVVI